MTTALVPFTAVQSDDLRRSVVGTCRIVGMPFSARFMKKLLDGEVIGHSKDAEEAIRLLHDLMNAELIEFQSGYAEIGWNGFQFVLTAGLNRVPKPVYDVLVQSAQDKADGWATLDRDITAAMHRKGLPSVGEFQAALDEIEVAKFEAEKRESNTDLVRRTTSDPKFQAWLAAGKPSARKIPQIC